MADCCVYLTYDGYCILHSVGAEFREPCVRGDGPCDDERLPEPPEEPFGV